MWRNVAKCGMLQAVLLLLLLLLLLFGFCHTRCLPRLKIFTLLLLHVKNRYSCQVFMKLEMSSQIFEKCSNIKLHENQSIAQCGWTDGQKDMAKLITTFCNFAYAPRNERGTSSCKQKTSKQESTSEIKAYWGGGDEGS